MSTGYKYASFISYSHEDKAWGDRLHRALERYAVPKRLQGQEGRDGPIPPRIFPVFRDREELPSSSDLNDQIRSALEASATLVVICSPRAAKSRWVNEEILIFKRLGRANRILALIIDGEPNASDKPGAAAADECFPPALRFRLGEDGELSNQRVEPVAADARPQGDGEENARLKIIAGILGVGFGQLKQRDLEAQRSRLRRLAAVAGAVAITLTGLLVLSVYFARQARDERDRALRLLGDSYAVRARDLATAGRYDAATRLALVALRASENRSAIAADVLREAGSQMAVRARFPMNLHPEISADLSPDGRLLASGIGNDVQVWDTATSHLKLALRGHTASVRTVDFSQDGARLVSASEDGTARIWDGASGKPLAVMGGTDPMWFAKFWRNGDAVVTATARGMIQVWDTRQHRQIASLGMQGIVAELIEGGVTPASLDVLGGVSQLEVSADGRKIVAVSRMGGVALVIFDEEGNFATTLLAGGAILDVKIAPDSRHVVTTALSGPGKLWNASTGELVREVGQTEGFGRAAFSADGSRVVFVGNDGMVRITHVDSGEVLHTSLHQAPAAEQLAFSWDGRRLAIARVNGSIDVVDIGREESLIASLTGHAANVSALTFSPDGQALYSSSWDGTLREWSLEPVGPRRFQSVPLTSRDGSSVAIAGGRTFVSGGEGLRSIEHGSFTVREHAGEAAGSLFPSRKGDRLAIIGPRSLVRDASTGATVLLEEGDLRDLVVVDWSLDDARVAAAAHEHGAFVWDSRTGRVVAYIEAAEGKPIVDARFSRDGSKLLVLDGAGALDVRDLSGRRILQIGGAAARHSAFAVSASTGDVISGGNEGELRIWDVNTGALKTNLAGHERGLLGGHFRAVGFSDDGRYAFSRSMDGTAKVWDLTTGVAVRSFPVEGDDENACVAFLPGSQHIALTSQNDGRVVNVATGQVTMTFPDLRGCLLFTPDRRTAAGRTYYDAAIWDTSRVVMSVEQLVELACAQGGLPLTSRTFTKAEGDVDQIIHNLRLDASGREIDVCSGEAAPSPSPAVAQAQGDPVRFNASLQGRDEMIDAWFKAHEDVLKLFEAGKAADAYAIVEKNLAAAREIVNWHGRSMATRRVLVHAIVFQAGAMVDQRRDADARQLLDEADALFAAIERFGEMEERVAALRANARAARTALETRQ